MGSYKNSSTYGEFLASEEGMATNILASRLAHFSCDFRFWESQEEEIDSDYLQFASYYRREGKSTTSDKGGRGDANQGVVAAFSKIGKDETDGWLPVSSNMKSSTFL